MLRLSPDMLSAIGGTPLVRLRNVVPAGCARVVVKLESANPTGSMKDRMARAAIEAAEAAGRLRPGDTVVEYTGGTTGVSLAFVCAVKGYRMEIVFSDAFSPEKGQVMRAPGARLKYARWWRGTRNSLSSDGRRSCLTKPRASPFKTTSSGSG